MDLPCVGLSSFGFKLLGSEDMKVPSNFKARARHNVSTYI